MRYASFLSGLPNPARDFVDDHVVMGRVSAQQASETDNGVAFLCFGKSARYGRDFESTGNTHDLNVSFVRARAHQAVVSASQQTVSDEFIESRNDDSKTKARCVQISGTRFPPNPFFGVVLGVPVSRS